MHYNVAVTMKGIKRGKSVLLNVEPPVKDGTEVEVSIPQTPDEVQELWEEQGRALSSRSVYPNCSGLSQIAPGQNESLCLPFPPRRLRHDMGDDLPGLRRAEAPLVMSRDRSLYDDCEV